MLVERGLLRSAAAALSEMIPSGARVFAITSPNIRKHWGKVLQKSFTPASRNQTVRQLRIKMRRVAFLQIIRPANQR